MGGWVVVVGHAFRRLRLAMLLYSSFLYPHDGGDRAVSSVPFYADMRSKIACNDGPCVRACVRACVQ